MIAACLTDDTQFAYKERRSIEDALAVLLDIVSKHLDTNSKNYVRGLFVDFTSAFNTISPTLLIEQLMKTSLHSNIVNLVYNFLTDRRQSVHTQLAPAGLRMESATILYICSTYAITIYRRLSPNQICRCSQVPRRLLK